MSDSKASVLARDVLNGYLAGLDSEINWRTDDLIESQANILKLRVKLDELRAKRTALKDAVQIHFPVATW